ncbi:hypothetical protein F5Y01DRAFT_310466 [Xylaria sp. FL0043]|nr:hypothetical protein F5Y01DRAFT_310466 [Xylaria sp. FL0043]
MTIHGSLSLDICWMIFDELVGDCETLARVGLVSRSWRNISLPALLNHVDLSSHNNGRVPEERTKDSPEVIKYEGGVVMADFHSWWRPRNLVPRQRAFLRLMADRPELAIYIKAFTWTFVWKDFGEDCLTDIDRQTWDIFGRMQNVTRLDLASIHSIGNVPYIRQSPARLFPAVTHLRLVGWMHRGLVRAIISSLDAAKLASLELHHLQDEGSLPNGEPMSWDFSKHYLIGGGEGLNPYRHEGIDDDLWQRQEQGNAAIFPGPMWFPLRFLRQKCLSSMTHVRIALKPSSRLDHRSLISMFADTAALIRSTKDTLQSLSIELGEEAYLHCKDEELHNYFWGTQRDWQRPWHFHQASAFLHRLLPALTEERFPHLTRVDLKGFRILLVATVSGENHDRTLRCIRDCPFVDEGLMKIANLDCRYPFDGYLVSMHGCEEMEEEMRRNLNTS